MHRQNFVEKFVLSFFNIVQAATCSQLSENSEKSLGKKWQALRYLEKSLSKKTPLKNMVYPETPFQLGLKTIKYFAALEQSSNKRKKLRSSDYERVDQSMLELLQRFISWL